MENRRQDYRHIFRPHERRQVQMSAAAAGTLRGELLDLSLGGVRVRLPGGAPPLKPQERCRVQLEVDSDQALLFDAEVIHREPDPEASCGLRFLPLVDVNAWELRERRLWKFLLEEQRRLRRQRNS